MKGETFSIGEVALFVREGSRYFGVEVTISEPLAIRRVCDQRDGARYYAWTYGIEGPFERMAGTNGKFSTRPQDLRKRRPPQDWQALCNVEAPARELEIA
jgi:hypothetical protein